MPGIARWLGLCWMRRRYLGKVTGWRMRQLVAIHCLIRSAKHAIVIIQTILNIQTIENTQKIHNIRECHSQNSLREVRVLWCDFFGLIGRAYCCFCCCCFFFNLILLCMSSFEGTFLPYFCFLVGLAISCCYILGGSYSCSSKFLSLKRR